MMVTGIKLLDNGNINEAHAFCIFAPFCVQLLNILQGSSLVPHVLFYRKHSDGEDQLPQHKS